MIVFLLNLSDTVYSATVEVRIAILDQNFFFQIVKMVFDTLFVSHNQVANIVQRVDFCIYYSNFDDKHYFMGGTAFQCPPTHPAIRQEGVREALLHQIR